MGKSKVAITLNSEMVRQIDRLVDQRKYPSRSRAIEEAVEEKLRRLDRRRLAEECGKLDPKFEKDLSEEGLTEEVAGWPEY